MEQYSNRTDSTRTAAIRLTEWQEAAHRWTGHLHSLSLPPTRRVAIINNTSLSFLSLPPSLAQVISTEVEEREKERQEMTKIVVALMCCVHCSVTLAMSDGCSFAPVLQNDRCQSRHPSYLLLLMTPLSIHPLIVCQLPPHINF